MTRRPEQQIQRAVFAHFCARSAPGVFAFHPANGGYRRPIEAKILKGSASLAVCRTSSAFKDGRCYALELKAEGGKLTDVQRMVLIGCAKPVQWRRSARARSGDLASLRAGDFWGDRHDFSAVQAHRRHARTAIGIIGGTTWQIGGSSHE